MEVIIVEVLELSKLSVLVFGARYGNANNTVFVTVKKQMPHLFDRLTFEKPSKVVC